MDYPYFDSIIQNEINTLQKLRPDRFGSMILGFIFIIASFFVEKKKK